MPTGGSKIDSGENCFPLKVANQLASYFYTSPGPIRIDIVVSKQPSQCGLAWFEVRFVGNSIRQRAATFSLPDSVSKRAVVDKRSSLREESVKRYVHDLSEEFAHPKINVLHHAPTFLTVGSKKHRRRQR